MINKIFQYDCVNRRVELNVPEILLVKEFSRLMDKDRNISKEDPKGDLKLRAFKELSYIWLAIDWQSVYSDYTELERHQEALQDSGLTEELFNDPDFRAACRKYRDLQESNRSVRLVQAARNTVDKFINYFLNINPEERDPLTGKPIFKVKDIMKEISEIEEVSDTVKSLEGKLKKELVEETSIRGGVQDGYIPKDF